MESENHPYSVDLPGSIKIEHLCVFAPEKENHEYAVTNA